MAYAIRNWGFASGAPCAVHGQFLKAFDPNAPEGKPVSEWTGRMRDAQQFPTVAAVLEEWKLVRTVDPVRPDGQPNRPLTAFNIESVKIPGTNDFLNPGEPG